VPVTQAEADAGEILNTAELSGTPAGGVLDPVSDDHVVNVGAAPSWELIKASSTAPTAAGQTLDYTFTVINQILIQVRPRFGRVLRFL